MKAILRHLYNMLGYRVVKRETSSTLDGFPPVEFSDRDSSMIEYVLKNRLTMVSKERLYATLMACKHVLSQRIPGDFVECGVWRGGNSLIAADVFACGETDRCVYLFDTFAGMTAPTQKDCRIWDGVGAMTEYLAGQTDTHNKWCYASLEDVKRSFADAKLLSTRIKFIKGDVIVSLQDEANLPAKISVLRLDTDWYESTRVELEILYPLLSPGGVLIVDDYGHWGGAKKAVDEYFEYRARPLLQYTDYTGRMGVKPC